MYDEVELRWNLWGWHAGLQEILCGLAAIEMFPELEGRECIYACFSSKKPTHNQFFTITKPRNHSWEGRVSRVREYRKHLFAEACNLLAEKYDEGFRYVWLEYEQDT